MSANSSSIHKHILWLGGEKEAYSAILADIKVQQLFTEELDWNFEIMKIFYVRRYFTDQMNLGLLWRFNNRLGNFKPPS
jgi:hypothetical protein